MIGRESRQDITVIKLPDRMDSVTASSAEQALRSAVRPGAKVIVDGSAITYMSAAGVRALAEVLHGAEAMQAHVVFCNFAGPATDCLEVSGFTQLFDVANTVEEATSRLRAAPAPSSKRLHRRGAAG